MKISMKHTLLGAAVAGAVLAIAGVSGSTRVSAQTPASGGIETLRVQDDVYMLVGDGANITVQAGPQGVLVVDTGTGAKADQVIAAIRKLSTMPIRYVLNTSADADHAGGNEKIVVAGEAIPGRNFAGEGAELIAHENVLNRLSAARVPIAAVPTSSYFVPQKDLYFNGQAIQMIHVPNAHGDGDSMIYFRKADVLAVGEMYSTVGYPVIDTKHGGTINGVIAGLNRILDIQVAGEKEEGGTMVVPARGRISDEADVVEYRDMVTIIRDRVQDLAAKGKTLDQIKAAGITLDFDGRYGATTGEWTTNMFLDAVYGTLKPTAAQAAKTPASKDRDAKEPKKQAQAKK